MDGRPSAGENATVGLEPECGNVTSGNCSYGRVIVGGGGPGVWMITSWMLYAVICAAGTVGNGLVIYVVLRSLTIGRSAASGISAR